MKRAVIVVLALASLVFLYVPALAQDLEPKVYLPILSGGTGTQATPQPTIVPTTAPTLVPTPTVEPSVTVVPTPELTPQPPTPTATPTGTFTATATSTATPTGTATATSTATSTPLPPPPPPISILSSRIDVEGERLYVEIQNIGTAKACDVRVDARLYDSANQIVGVAYSYSRLRVINPGEKSPLAIFISNSITGIASYAVSVASLGTCPLAAERITVFSYVVTYDPPIINTKVAGEIKNQTPYTVNFAEVVATFYTPQGAIWWAGSTYGTNPLAPGAIGIYQLYTQDDLRGLPFVLVAQAFR